VRTFAPLRLDLEFLLCGCKSQIRHGDYHLNPHPNIWVGVFYL
jgi:hypothetical protein